MLQLLDRLAGWYLTQRTNWEVKHNPAIRDHFQLQRADMTPEGMELVLDAPGIVMLAEEAARVLNYRHAENYVEFDIMPRLDKGIRPIRLTIQYASGMSPAQKVAMLEARIKELTHEQTH